MSKEKNKHYTADQLQALIPVKEIGDCVRVTYNSHLGGRFVNRLEQVDLSKIGQLVICAESENDKGTNYEIFNHQSGKAFSAEAITSKHPEVDPWSEFGLYPKDAGLDTPIQSPEEVARIKDEIHEHKKWCYDNTVKIMDKAGVQNADKMEGFDKINIYEHPELFISKGDLQPHTLKPEEVIEARAAGKLIVNGGKATLSEEEVYALSRRMNNTAQQRIEKGDQGVVNIDGNTGYYTEEMIREIRTQYAEAMRRFALLRGPQNDSSKQK